MKNKKAIIGKFYNNLKQAEEYRKEKERLFKSNFVILEIKNGWLVLSEKQVLTLSSK